MYASPGMGFSLPSWLSKSVKTAASTVVGSLRVSVPTRYGPQVMTFKELRDAATGAQIVQAPTRGELTTSPIVNEAMTWLPWVALGVVALLVLPKMIKGGRS